MTPSAVIFDFGNVINRWQPTEALMPLYGDLELAEQAMVRHAFKEWVADILDAGDDVEASLMIMKAQNFARFQMFETYMENIELAHAKPVDGTLDVIRLLYGNNIRLFGMTNAGIAASEALKQLYPVIGLMEDVFVSGKEKCMKPQPEAFGLLLGRNGLWAEECVFVDDAYANALGAQAVGIRSILFTDAPSLQADLTHLRLLPAGASQ